MARPLFSSQALRALLLHSHTVANCKRLLLIDPAFELPAALRDIDGLNLTSTRFEMLDSDLLDSARPEMILAPLMTPRFDILDLARKLDGLGYGGALRAYSAPLPSVQLIRAEMRSDFPKLDFDIFAVPDVGDREN
ncbi:MAG: hypothetical protein H5U24_18310 [Thioclava marina]|jgi:hypothetical protein|uniref:Uncharacterized protein n=1 Tax=Thioclava marina TaxID=1915077 RepID=A0ABX3MP17_9RHOB|nr:hypothetical protein [Thioclava marina]MBC7147329.1 hypothetical protein [Thioclava marina]OOY12908.1 hypothetical protein BMG00_03570 [Thioclava marina]TNF11496.1 MAG: hypothetical protein EP320_14600 [Paracoccaceae bacterium]